MSFKLLTGSGRSGHGSKILTQFHLCRPLSDSGSDVAEKGRAGHGPYSPVPSRENHVKEKTEKGKKIVEGVLIKVRTENGVHTVPTPVKPSTACKSANDGSGSIV